MITVRLIKPLKGKIIRYEAELIARDATSMLVRARWDAGAFDLGVLNFTPGDWLHEYFYTDRWYNIFRLDSAEGRLKGWYCNITRPAIIDANAIESEDLELDLLISADRSQIRLDDEDEFAARNLDVEDPAAHRAALAAVTELRTLAQNGLPPFDVR